MNLIMLQSETDWSSFRRGSWICSSAYALGIPFDGEFVVTLSTVLTGFLPQVGDYLPLAALKQARLRGACSA
jgi:hypothetical protein